MFGLWNAFTDRDYINGTYVGEALNMVRGEDQTWRPKKVDPDEENEKILSYPMIQQPQSDVVTTAVAYLTTSNGFKVPSLEVYGNNYDLTAASAIAGIKMPLWQIWQNAYPEYANPANHPLALPNWAPNPFVTENLGPYYPRINDIYKLIASHGMTTIPVVFGSFMYKPEYNNIHNPYPDIFNIAQNAILTETYRTEALNIKNRVFGPVLDFENRMIMPQVAEGDEWEVDHNLRVYYNKKLYWDNFDRWKVTCVYVQNANIRNAFNSEGANNVYILGFDNSIDTREGILFNAAKEILTTQQTISDEAFVDFIRDLETWNSAVFAMYVERCALYHIDLPWFIEQRQDEPTLYYLTRWQTAKFLTPFAFKMYNRIAAKKYGHDVFLTKLELKELGVRFLQNPEMGLLTESMEIFEKMYDIMNWQKAGQKLVDEGFAEAEVILFDQLYNARKRAKGGVIMEGGIHMAPSVQDAHFKSTGAMFTMADARASATGRVSSHTGAGAGTGVGVGGPGTAVTRAVANEVAQTLSEQNKVTTQLNQAATVNAMKNSASMKVADAVIGVVEESINAFTATTAADKQKAIGNRNAIIVDTAKQGAKAVIKKAASMLQTNERKMVEETATERQGVRNWITSLSKKFSDNASRLWYGDTYVNNKKAAEEEAAAAQAVATGATTQDNKGNAVVPGIVNRDGTMIPEKAPRIEEEEKGPRMERNETAHINQVHRNLATDNQARAALEEGNKGQGFLQYPPQVVLPGNQGYDTDPMLEMQTKPNIGARIAAQHDKLIPDKERERRRRGELTYSNIKALEGTPEGELVNMNAKSQIIDPNVPAAGPSAHGEGAQGGSFGAQGGIDEEAWREYDEILNFREQLNSGKPTITARESQYGRPIDARQLDGVDADEAEEMLKRAGLLKNKKVEFPKLTAEEKAALSTYVKKIDNLRATLIAKKSQIKSGVHKLTAEEEKNIDDMLARLDVLRSYVPESTIEKRHPPPKGAPSASTSTISNAGDPKKAEANAEAAKELKPTFLERIRSYFPTLKEKFGSAQLKLASFANDHSRVIAGSLGYTAGAILMRPSAVDEQNLRTWARNKYGYNKPHSIAPARIPRDASSALEANRPLLKRRREYDSPDSEEEDIRYEDEDRMPYQYKRSSYIAETLGANTPASRPGKKIHSYAANGERIHNGGNAARNVLR